MCGRSRHTGCAHASQWAQPLACGRPRSPACCTTNTSPRPPSRSSPVPACRKAGPPPPPRHARRRTRSSSSRGAESASQCGEQGEAASLLLQWAAKEARKEERIRPWAWIEEAGGGGRPSKWARSSGAPPKVTQQEQNHNPPLGRGTGPGLGGPGRRGRWRRAAPGSCRGPAWGGG